jgi:uncharacterized membrane protein
MNTLKPARIQSIDILRGLIMIIMALDHTRDYFHADAFVYDPLDLEKTTVLLYFTRWITHFCAPIFILLAGTSAFISGQRKTKKELAVFLVKRGLWLIILEETIVNFGWFFNVHFNFFIFGVIWVLGLSMIILAGLLFLPRKLIFWIGLIMVVGHNLLDPTHFRDNNVSGFIWGVLHDRKTFSIGRIRIEEAYHVIPWAGVMALGYCLGPIFANGFDPTRRKKILLRLGLTSLMIFSIIRGINVYGDIYPWYGQSSFVLSFLSFINVSKYPPSLDYLLVTLGAAFIFLALTEKISNGFTRFISLYGRVPLFYYILHIFLIHLFAMLAAVLTGYQWTAMTGFNGWISSMPSLQGYGFSLGFVYLIWISIVLLLYPLCKKYDRYKSANRDKWWLSYL